MNQVIVDSKAVDLMCIEILSTSQVGSIHMFLSDAQAFLAMHYSVHNTMHQEKYYRLSTINSRSNVCCLLRTLCNLTYADGLSAVYLTWK